MAQSIFLRVGGAPLKLTGNATASDVLDGKTFYKDDPKVIITGTMPNKGAVTGSVAVGGTYTIPAGYHNGSGKVTGPTLSGDALTDNVLSGKTFYSNNGTKQTGTMPERSASGDVTLDLSTTSKSYAAGYYPNVHGAIQGISRKSVLANAGGDIQSQAAQTITPGTSNKTIDSGKYLSGVQTIKGDANLIAANIIAGKSIFGVAGTAKKDIHSMSCLSIYISGDSEDDDHKSFTMPRAGIVCYSGFSFSVSSYYSGSCRILRNGSVVDSRDINNGDYKYRGTMMNKSFSAAAGDVIELQTSRNGSYTGGCIMTAVIFY